MYARPYLLPQLKCAGPHQALQRQVTGLHLRLQRRSTTPKRLAQQMNIRAKAARACLLVKDDLQSGELHTFYCDGGWSYSECVCDLSPHELADLVPHHPLKLSKVQPPFAVKKGPSPRHDVKILFWDVDARREVLRQQRKFKWCAAIWHIRIEESWFGLSCKWILVGTLMTGLTTPVSKWTLKFVEDIIPGPWGSGGARCLTSCPSHARPASAVTGKEDDLWEHIRAIKTLTYFEWGRKMRHKDAAQIQPLDADSKFCHHKFFCPGFLPLQILRSSNLK